MNTCSTCFHFKMDTELTYMLICGKVVSGFFHRCVFNHRQKNANKQACKRYVNRTQRQAEIDRKRYGFDGAVETTVNAKQEDLI